MENDDRKRAVSDKGTLRGSADMLRRLADICDRCASEGVPWASACREAGILPAKARSVVLGVHKCMGSGARLELDGARDLCGDFYAAIFGQKAAERAMLPIDCRESVRYVVWDTGLPSPMPDVLDMRFGVSAGEPMARTRVWEKTGLSVSKLQRIEAKALHMVRASYRRDILAMGLGAYMQQKMHREAERAALIQKMDEEHEQRLRAIAERKAGAGLSGEDAIKALERTGIERLDLPVRPFNALRRAGITTLLDVIRKMNGTRLSSISNMGKKSEQELKARLDAYSKDRWCIPLDELCGTVRRIDESEGRL